MKLFPFRYLLLWTFALFPIFHHYKQCLQNASERGQMSLFFPLSLLNILGCSGMLNFQEDCCLCTARSFLIHCYFIPSLLLGCEVSPYRWLRANLKSRSQAFWFSWPFTGENLSRYFLQVVLVSVRGSGASSDTHGSIWRAWDGMRR